MLRLLILLLSLHTVVFAQRFLPGFRGFGPPGGGPGFFGGGPPFGGPGFDFGPGPGAGGFLPDFPAIGGPSIFTPPRGPPDFDRIRRENGGFPVWGGAGINREDGTRAFDGWDGDPARLGVGSFSSQVGPSHLLESQHGSSDDRDPTVVQTTRVVVRPSPFRIPRRPTPTRANQRETREQYTRSIAHVRRNTLSTHTQNNNQIPQTQNVRTGNNGYIQNNNRLIQAQNFQNNENGNSNHRVPHTQRVPINSRTNSNSRQVHLSHRNNIPVVSQRHNIPPQDSLRDTGQQGILRHQGQRNQNVPPSTQTRTLQTSSAGQSTVVNRQARRSMPLVYSQRFISQHRGSNNHIIDTNNGVNSGNENDPNNLSPAINDAAWIPGPIPGLELINNNRQNTGYPQNNVNSRNTNSNNGFQNSPGIRSAGPIVADNQNNRHQPLTGSIASRRPITNNQPLPGQNIDPDTQPNNQPPRDHQSFLLPSSNRHNNLVVKDKLEPGPLSISIQPGVPKPPLPPHHPLPQRGTVGPPTNHQQRSLDHPHPPNQQQPLVPSHQEPPPNHASQGSNPDPLVPSGQHSTAEAGPGGIGGVFGGPTGGATTGGGGATGGGGRFADPTTGERIQVVSSDMANAVRQARVGGDPRAGTFGRGPSVGQGIPPQGRFVPDRTFVSGPGPVGVGPQGVGMGPQGFGSQGGGVGGVGPQGIGGPSMGPGSRFDGGPSMGPGGRFDGGSSMGPGGRFDGRPGFMGPGAGPRSGAGLLSGPGGPIRIRVPADGGRPIITRDGVSQPLPPGMSLTDLGISSPPPSRPIRGPGPGAINNNNINNGFIQNGGDGFSNGTLPRLLLVGDPGMSNISRLSRFQSGYGMFGRGRVYENLLSSLGGHYVQVLLPGQRHVNNQVGNAVSTNANVVYINNSTGNILPSPNNNDNNNNINNNGNNNYNNNNNNNNNVPVIVQSHTPAHIPVETTPPTIKTTTPPTQAPVTSSLPPSTTTTTDIPEEIEPTPSMYHGAHIDTVGTSYAGLSKFQRTVADMLGLSASHVLIRNLSMIENMAHMNGFEIELEREGAMAAMQKHNENQLMPETTTVAITTPLTTASVIPLETSPPVRITHPSQLTNVNNVNNIHGTSTNNNIENNLTQNGFLRTLNSLLASGKRQVNVNFDTNTGVYKLSTKPVVQAPAPEWQPAHAQRREHPSVAHTLTGFLPPQFDPGVMVQPTGGQTMVTGVSGPGPADMGHSHSSGGLGEVHNNNNIVANNNNNLDVGVNNNGAPDLLVIQMADLRNRDNLPAIMNALENIANAQGGGGSGAPAGVVGPVGIDNRNNAMGGGRI